MSFLRLSLLFLILTNAVQVASAQQEGMPPKEVGVLPVFFVPSDQPDPTEEQKANLMRHLKWAQARYLEMLQERSTFRLARAEPAVFTARHPLAYYKLQPEGGAPQFTAELLTKLGMNRYQCPYVFVIVVVNTEDAFPHGGGRPFNGGFNTGGGMIKLSTHDLDQAPNFQSTLQHELGHAFGLPHVDVYGYPMRHNDSIMAYNKAHHTKGFEPSQTPGQLIPEDVRGFSFNDRVFPGLEFDAAVDLPSGYEMKRVITLGPMTIPGQPAGVQARTRSGETFGSSISNVVQGQILPSEKGGRFDPKTMWHSATLPRGNAGIELEFPYVVELTRMILYTEHSGESHRATEVRVATQLEDGSFENVVTTPVAEADHVIDFPQPAQAKIWKLNLKTGASKRMAVRGIRFFSGEEEVFSPIIPYPFD